MLTDTHCHIHDREFFPDDREAVYQRAIDANVKMFCVGTSQADSRTAVEFAKEHDNTWAIVGVHPHEVKEGWGEIGAILADNFVRKVTARTSITVGTRRQPSFSGGQRSPKIIAIGEIGLDYFYDNSPRQVQVQALEQQLQWARDYDLPVSFHVRDAYDDFWPIFDNFPGIRGVLHSFTDTIPTLETALAYGLFIGVNGISTFARDKQAMFDTLPLEKMLLETDAPFLTPVPYRGKVNEPAFVRNVAEYHAQRREVALEHLARVTSANARALFAL